MGFTERIRSIDGKKGGFHVCGNVENYGVVATAPDTVYWCRASGCSGNLVNTGTGSFIADCSWMTPLVNAHPAGSEYMSASVPSCSFLLPIELLSFKGREGAGYVDLSWTSEEPANENPFSVERGYDGKHFEEIGRVAVKQASSDYEFRDNNPKEGANYYRLARKNAADEQEYTDVIAIQVHSVDKVAVYPNPALPGQAVEIRVNDGPAEGDFHVVVTNTLGEEVYRQVMTRNGNSFSATLSASNPLQPGMYVLSGDREEKMFVKRLTVVK